MKINKILMSITAAAALVSTSGTSIAATDSADLTVSATVAAVCQISGTSEVAFGTMAANDAATYDATGNVAWVCTSGTSPIISVNGGGSGDISARTMTGGVTGDNLDYQLFTSAARDTVFGNGTTGSTITGTGLGMSNTVTTSIYGQILDADVATASADSYSDIVSVTLEF